VQWEYRDKSSDINSRGDVVLECSAEVAQWEGADAHLLAVYGFSIVEIVKDDPRQKTAQLKDKPCANVISWIRTPKYTFNHLVALSLPLNSLR
jgi:hypothetical protein